MERLTIKNESIDKPYVEMDSLEMSFRHPPIYTTNCYTGKAIDKLSELEDVLEEFELTSAEDLRNHLNFQDNLAIWEGELNYKNQIKDLQHQLAVKDRALKLACERIKNMYEQERQYCTNEIPNFVEVEKVYFVEQAEKELKDE